MCLLGDRGGKRIFKSVYFPTISGETARGDDTTDGNREKLSSPSTTRLRKRKKKRREEKRGEKKGKKKGERKIERSEDSTRPMNYARVCIQGKLTGRYAIIRSHLGKRWLLRSPPTGNYHGGK